MNWFLYDNGLRHERVKHFFLALQLLLSERQSLHDNLCLIDPLIIGFDEKSVLNALLYGSDSTFRNKLLRFNIS